MLTYQYIVYIRNHLKSSYKEKPCLLITMHIPRTKIRSNPHNCHLISKTLGNKTYESYVVQFQNTLKPMKGPESRSSEGCQLQSNSKPCRRSELYSKVSYEDFKRMPYLTDKGINKLIVVTVNRCGSYATSPFVAHYSCSCVGGSISNLLSAQ